MPNIDRLRDAGYTVEQITPAEAGRAAVYYVTGTGVAVYVSENDYDIQQSLLNAQQDTGATT